MHIARVVPRVLRADLEQPALQRAPQRPRSASARAISAGNSVTTSIRMSSPAPAPPAQSQSTTISPRARDPRAASAAARPAPSTRAVRRAPPSPHAPAHPRNARTTPSGDALEIRAPRSRSGRRGSTPAPRSAAARARSTSTAAPVSAAAASRSVDARELHASAPVRCAPAPLGTAVALATAAGPQHPLAILEQRFGRIGVRAHMHPTADAEGRTDPPQLDERSGSAAQRSAPAARAALSLRRPACDRRSTSCFTRSDGCAPLLDPVLDARADRACSFCLAAARDRVEEADALEARAALALAAVGHHDVIEGLILARPRRVRRIVTMIVSLSVQRA